MSDVPKAPRKSLWRELAPGEILRDGAGRDYRIVRFLAEGGYSQVYEAERALDTEAHPRVAIKVLNLKHGKNKKAIRRQMSEARGLYKLNHPNVVRVHAIGMREETGTVFMVMDLLVGRTLRDLVRDLGGRMPIPWTLEIMISVCRGLSAIHTLAVHRDLKPENTHARDDGHISLFDLGTSRFSKEERLTTQGYTIGTLDYMSPEQLAGDTELDGRSDLFAVGTMLYELLTGKNPFTGRNGTRDRQEIGRQIMFGQHIPISELREPGSAGEPGKLIAPNVPRDLVDIVERLLRKDRAGRYESATLVADLLTAALAKFTFDNQAYPALPISTLGEVPRTPEPDEADEHDDVEAELSAPTSTNPFLSVSFPPEAPTREDEGAARLAPSIAYASTEQIATYAMPAPRSAQPSHAAAVTEEIEAFEEMDESAEPDEPDEPDERKPAWRFESVAKLHRAPVEETGSDAIYMDPDALANSTLTPHEKQLRNDRSLPTERVRALRAPRAREVPPVFFYMIAVAALVVAAFFVLGALGVLGHRPAAQASPAPRASGVPAPEPSPTAKVEPRPEPTAPRLEIAIDAGPPAPAPPRPPPSSSAPQSRPPVPSARPRIEPVSRPRLIF
jgi:serine/threonine protein kinase